MAALALCFGAVLTGCAGIPDSGPVQRGSPVTAQKEPALIEFRPDGPLPGDSPQQVVEGFLAAMQAYPPSSLTARRFLTTPASANWRPETSTSIYSDHVSKVGVDGSVTLRATMLATLSAQGSWTSAAFGGQTYSRDMGLVRVRGQWRIGNPPVGSLVSQSYFERYYRPYSLYFLARTRDVVVPDLRYLVERPQTPTLLVEGLLAGPIPRLAPAVDTLVPASTEVNVSVPVSPAGLADVALSRDVLALSGEDRQLLLAQLVWTLRQVTGITGVRVTAGGAGLEIPGSSGVSSVDTLPGFDPAGFAATRSLFGLSGDQLVTVSGSQATPVEGLLGSGELPATSFAVDIPGRRAAVVSADRRSIVVSAFTAGASDAGQQADEWYAAAKGSRLLQPSWDRTGRLWVVDQTSDGARIVVVRNARPTTLVVPGLSGRTVRALRVSRDGTRLAAVVVAGDQGRLVLAEIVRSTDGSVRAVSRPRPVVSPVLKLDNVMDVGWTSPTSLGVLVRVRAEGRQPYVVAMDGSSVTASSALPDAAATALAASANAEVPVVVSTRDGKLWIQRTDLSWARLAGGSPIRSPAYVG